MPLPNVPRVHPRASKRKQQNHSETGEDINRGRSGDVPTPATASAPANSAVKKRSKQPSKKQINKSAQSVQQQARKPFELHPKSPSPKTHRPKKKKKPKKAKPAAYPDGVQATSSLPQEAAPTFPSHNVLDSAKALATSARPTTGVRDSAHAEFGGGGGGGHCYTRWTASWKALLEALQSLTTAHPAARAHDERGNSTSTTTAELLECMQLHHAKVCAGRGGAQRSASDARKALQKQIRAKLTRLIDLGYAVQLTGTHNLAQFTVTPRGCRQIQADLQLHERPAAQATTQTATSRLPQRRQQGKRTVLVTELVAALQPAFDTVLAELRQVRALVGRGRNGDTSVQ